MVIYNEYVHSTELFLIQRPIVLDVVYVYGKSELFSSSNYLKVYITQNFGPLMARVNINVVSLSTNIVNFHLNLSVSQLMKFKL